MEITGNYPVIKTTSSALVPAEPVATNDLETNPTLTTEVQSTTTATEPEVDASLKESGKAAGVIRKLQAGQFRGVADIRLRINFNDQLQALQTQKTSQAVDSAIPAIIDSQTSEVTNFLETGTVDSEIAGKISSASQLFADEIENIAGGIQSQVQAGDLIAQLQSSFDNFISELSQIDIAGQEPEEVDEVIVEDQSANATTLKNDDLSIMATLQSDAVEGNIETSSELVDMSQLIASLTESFNSELDSLISDLANSSVLPPISEPNGNGGAYEKFMKIYNNMNDLAVVEKQPETTLDPVTVSDTDVLSEVASTPETISVLAR